MNGSDMNEVDSGELERQHSVGIYPSRGVTLVKGSGAAVWDDQGRRYIDCASGVGVASVGHANEELASAIAEQARTLMVCAGVLHNDVRAKCMAKLASITPDGLDRVFLCNSGAESIEAAIKFARQSTGRHGVVSAMRGFHGRTLGALSATHKKEYQEPFAPLLSGFAKISYNRTESLDAAVDDNTAAVILELVQGEGGVRPANAEFIRAAAQICSQRGALLVIDEIQTGFCRTGKMFACDIYDVRPDILCLAKGIAGGVPMGATVVNRKVNCEIGTHGSTFGGNPLASAAFLKVLEILERDNMADHARNLGDFAAELLAAQRIPVIREVRHLGLMIGIDLRKKATPYLQALMNHGVIALPAGPTVIRLLPPLVIDEQEMGEVIRAVTSVLSE